MADYAKIVDYTEKLAMLSIPESEKKEFTAQVGKILEMIEKLNELDTGNIKPTSHILPVQNVTRPDESRPSMERGEFFRIAPDHDNVFFKVPQVIQES